MKIGDEAPRVHRAESTPARPAHAGTWLAQLERAWLDGWSAGGERAASAAHGHAADSDLWDASQAVAAATSVAASAACGVVSSVPVWPTPETAGTNSGVDRSPGSVPQQFFRAMAPGAWVPTFACDRPALPQAVQRAQIPSEPGTDVELPSARNAAQQPHAAMEPPPARTLLQVTVSQSTAQVTLRDASLSQGDVCRTGLAVASQLLGQGLGLQAVRVYVNGVESRYGSLASNAEPVRDHEAAGADSHSSSHRLLERK